MSGAGPADEAKDQLGRAANRSRRSPPTHAPKGASRLRLRRHLLPGYYPTPLRSPRSAIGPERLLRNFANLVCRGERI